MQRSTYHGKPSLKGYTYNIGHASVVRVTWQKGQKGCERQTTRESAVKISPRQELCRQEQNNGKYQMYMLIRNGENLQWTTYRQLIERRISFSSGWAPLLAGHYRVGSLETIYIHNTKKHTQQILYTHTHMYVTIIIKKRGYQLVSCRNHGEFKGG